jgi:hypothetical protein
MFSAQEGGLEDMDVETPQIDQPSKDYSYSQSAQTRKTMVRTRKKTSGSEAKGSDNNKSAQTAEKIPPKKA